MAVTYNRYKFVNLRPFHFRNGYLDPEAVLKIRWSFYKALNIIVLQGGGDGRGYRNMYKHPDGPP
jgi:hypothetical protein